LTASVKRIVLDSLKPRETSIIELSQALCSIDGVDQVDITVTEVDVKTETIKLVIRGSNLNYEEISKTMADHGSTIRSIDEISVSKS